MLTTTSCTSLFPLLHLARAHVRRQMTILRRRVVAAGYGAFVRLLARVRAHVRRQRTILRRRVVAAGPGAFVRLLARVRRYAVRGQIKVPRVPGCRSRSVVASSTAGTGQWIGTGIKMNRNIKMNR